MAYTTLADMRTYLGVKVENTSDDTLITALIARAQALIDAHCGGRTFEAAADSTRYFNASEDTDGLYLFLDNDLCQITTVKNNLDNGSGGVTITSTQYVTNPRNNTPWFALKLLSSSGVSWQYTSDPDGAISILGRWAYSVSAPADIVQACIRWTAYLYKQKDAVVEVVANPETGGYRVPAGIPDDIAQMLEPYVRRV